MGTEIVISKSVLLAIVLAPLIGAILAGLFGKRIGRVGAHTVTIGGVAIACGLSMYVLWQLVGQGAVPFNQNIYTWFEIGGPGTTNSTCLGIAKTHIPNRSNANNSSCQQFIIVAAMQRFKGTGFASSADQNLPRLGARRQCCATLFPRDPSAAEDRAGHPPARKVDGDLVERVAWISQL